jgi:hypothetical protein
MFNHEEGHHVACWLYDRERDYREVSLEEAQKEASASQVV